MRLPEKICRRILIVLLNLMVIALLTVIIDYSGLTGNKGLSGRGENTLILFFIGTPLILITLNFNGPFKFYCKSLYYLFSGVKNGHESNKVERLVRILLFLSVFCTIWAVVDWVGITSSGLDPEGKIPVIMICLFLPVSLSLGYLAERRRNSLKKVRTPENDQYRNNFSKSRTQGIFIYSAIFILVFISFMLFFRLPGNIITSLVMLIQVWALFILLIQVISLAFRLIGDLKIKLFLSITVFMAGVLVIELFLRYAIGAHTTYLERDGFFNYVSSYETKREGERDPYIERYYVHKPNTDCTLNLTEFNYNLKTNSLGIRNNEITNTRDTNEFRIICLGDSFTEGFGADEENCWPRVLERELVKSIRNRKINVINAGTAGSDVIFEYTFLREKLLKLSPDMVIVCLNTSDISDIYVRGDFQRFKSEKEVEYKSPPAWEPVYARSFIFRHIIHNVCNLDPLFIPVKNVNTEILNSVEVINSTLRRFIELSDEHDFTFITVLHPYDYQIEDNHGPYSEMAGSLSSINKLHFFDMYDYFKTECGLNQNNIHNYSWKIDKHYNSKGYYLMAKGIEKYLLDSGFLTKD